jgi:hypothetical protein
MSVQPASAPRPRASDFASNRRTGLDIRLLTVLAIALLLSACGRSYVLHSSDIEHPDVSRIQTATSDGVRVSLRIPPDDEAAQTFGVTLADHGIQPIWIRLQNDSEANYWLLPIAIDPDYYSADEVAYVTSKNVPRAEQDAAREHFRELAVPFFLKAGSVSEGYLYASHMRGGRFVDLRLSGRGRAVRMRFAVLLPTQGFDYEHSALRELYGHVSELPDLSVEQARARIRGLPCCTTTEAGVGEGDPLNIALIGTAGDLVAALTASGWYFTEAITAESIRRMIGAAIAGEAFATAPVSPLYVFGRSQDLALQRGRSTINQRNHMRLWLAPFRCEGKPVWVGQVSRDIGVKVTGKSSTFTTHIIDPVVDESREYLLHSLLHHEAVGWFAFASGVGPSTRDEPRFNLTADPYFTDGMRMVIMLSRAPVAPEQAVNLGWNESTDPVREGKGEPATIPKSSP